MDIEKFNTYQMNKISNTLSEIIEQYKKLKEFINQYYESFVDIRNLLIKFNETKIVSQKFRQAYYILSKDFYNKYVDILESWNYMLHISIYLKKGVAEYVEENIITLPLFDIYREDLEYIIEVDENNFIIPVKIRTYLDNIDNIPASYYKPLKNKFMSTNKFALNVIDILLANIGDINTCLDKLIESASRRV